MECPAAFTLFFKAGKMPCSRSGNAINKLSTFNRRYSQGLSFAYGFIFLWFNLLTDKTVMKKFSLLCTLALLAGTMARAEMIWKPGFVITNNGDTIRGDVKVNDKKEYDLFRKVTLKLSETEKKMFNPSKIKSYVVDGQQFVVRKIDDEMVFVKVLSQGGVNLYQHQFEYYHGEEVRHDSEYYLEKSGTELTKVKGNKFKKIVAEVMADHTELVQKVQQSEGKYEGDAIVEVVEEYNAWRRKKS